MLAQAHPKRRRRAHQDSVLIVGCGDIARRLLPALTRRARVFALCRSPEAAAGLRARGAIPVPGDLDDAQSLKRIAGLAGALLHFAPPKPEGDEDSRTRRLLAALGRRPPNAIVYISTSGVYGDCAGDLVAETRPLNPATPRARRRADAETRLRRFALRQRCRLAILRAPGIHAPDRLPVERLKRGDPVLIEQDDVFTNHVDADELARLALTALHRGGHLRVYNACDGVHRKMGDYLDAVADWLGLPRPPRLSRSEIAEKLSPLNLSFLSESRRLDARRIARELRCPAPEDFLARPEHRENHDD